MDCTMSNHSNERFQERCILGNESNVSRKELMFQISNGNVVFAKRLTATRSLAYVTLPKKNDEQTIIKMIYHRKKKIIISVLPWKDMFKKVIKTNINDKAYTIELYPDCYLETKNNKALTQIHRIHTDNAREPINPLHPDFDELFQAAWEIYGNKVEMKDVA